VGNSRSVIARAAFAVLLFAAFSGAVLAQVKHFFTDILDAGRAVSSPTAFFGASPYGTTFVVDADNDSLQLRGTDRDYTNGTRVSLVRFRGDFLAAESSQELYTTAYGLQLGQNMYTPSDISLPPEQVDRRDHPYGAWLYAGLWKEEYRLSEGSGRYSRYELNLGCMGPWAQGEEVQKWVHERTNSRTPMGWDLQVEDALGVQARVEHSPFVMRSADGGLELVPRLSADVGNIFLQGAVGATVRLSLGRMIPFECGGERSPIAPFNMINPAAASARRGGRCEAPLEGFRQFYFFSRIEGKTVLYNALLQGPMLNDDSPHTVSPRRLLIDGEIGAALQWGAWNIRYSIATRSTEVKDQDWQLIRYRFGRAQVGYTWL
jgi:lipid A 3-O-deacylase